MKEEKSSSDDAIKIKNAEIEAAKVDSCLADKTGACNSCAIALLALARGRWIPLPESKAVKSIRTLCMDQAGASRPLSSLDHLVNKMASIGMGQRREERWE